MKKLKFLLLVLLCSSFSYAQNIKDINYTPVEVPKGMVESLGDIQINATNAKYYQFDPAQLIPQLQGIMKRDQENSGFIARINLPFPDGTMHSFNAKENNTMAAALSAQFPSIRSYDASGVDQVSFVKWDITPQGFHAMIMIPGESTVYIDPAIQGNDQYYIVYRRKDFTTKKQFDCSFTETSSGTSNPSAPVFKASYASCELRTYRIAIAATGEYTAFHGGTVAQAQAAQVTTMNRVNGIYERDAAVTFTIVGNNNLIVYANAGSDPYTNGNPGSMINENQTNITNVIGSANYDIGHVFGTNSGGLAGLGVVCINSQKARGVTGSGAPIGDPFDIDYVAHEVGHQFGARHTFNNSCNGNVSTTTSVEPGSGSTIMAYAGICAPNVQNNSDDHFSGKSLEEIGNTISGNSCPVVTVLANTPPSITATNGDVTVPANTPFALTATVTDAEGDPVTYNWEQMDVEMTTQPPVATATGGPNFRSFPSSTSPTRYFPNLADLASGAATTWEVIPSVSRTMNFRLTVRDNSSGAGGCNDYSDVTISTDANSGPFIVLYPSATGISFPGASTQTFTWDVANTDVAPVACSNVDILLSTDGGQTYPTVLASNVPNDGSQIVTIPNTPSTTARIMVICSNGTFFDVSDNNFTITAATNDYTLSVNPISVDVCQPNDAVYTININEIGNFSDPVNLSTSGLPTGAVATFSSASVTAPGTSTLTISNTAGVAVGNYTFDIIGNSTSGQKTVQVQLNVASGAPNAVTLNTPANGATDQTVPTNLVWTASSSPSVSYEIEVATDAGFTNIVSQATNLTQTNYSATGLSTGTTYYWRVRAVSGCGNSAWSPVFNFETNYCSTIAATDIPIAISASGTPTITSTINFPTGGTINDVNVIGLNGTHSYLEDLTIKLTGPSGTEVILVQTACGNQDDFNISFDDQAASGTLPCPYNDGNTYQPNGTLGNFNGQNPQGDWVLEISDGANQDGGSLEGWSLEICVDAPSCNEPEVPVVTATSICNGQTATLNIAGSLNDATEWSIYTGSCGGTLVGTTANGTFDVTPTATTTYYVRGTGGCTTPAACGTFEVTVNPLPSVPVITANGSTEFCQGGSVVLTSSAASSYLWSTGETTPSITVSATGNYTVEVTDGNGCSATSTATSVTVNQLPSVPVITANGSTEFCQGGSVVLTSSAASSYLWSTGETTPSITVSAAGNYTVEVTDGNGCSATSMATSVTVNPLPSVPVITANGSTEFCQGGSVVLTSSTASSYLWSTGETTPSITVSATGNYTVEVTDGNGCLATSTTTSVTVNPLPSVPVITANGSTEFCQGGSVVLTSSAASSYLWSTGETTPSITVSATGNYTVEVTDGNGCSAVSTATSVTVNPLPSVPVITANGSTEFCQGGSVVLTSSAASSYLWSTGETTPSITVSTAGNYTVEVTDGNGCSVISNATSVTVNPLPSVPVITANGSTEFCQGGSVVLTSSAASTYLWSTGETTPSITVSTAGNYTVEVTDGNGCSDVSNATSVTVNPVPVISLGAITSPSTCGNSDGSIVVNGSGTGDLSWTGNSNGNVSGQSLPYTINGLSAGGYQVTFSINGCSSELNASISDPSAPSTPVITANGSTEFCQGGSVVLTSSAASSYLWSTGETTSSITVSSAGNYTVEVTDGNGCSAVSNATSVTVNQLPSTPVITANGSTEFCQGGSVVLTSSAASSYLWSTGETTPSITVSAAGNYTVEVTDGNGCSAVSNATSVTVNQLPSTPVITANGSTEFCQGGSVVLTSSAASSYLWSTGETTSSITVSSAGNYTVEVTDGNGCSAVSNATSVTVNQLPSTPVITANGSTEFCQGGSVVLTSSAASSYLWSTGETTPSITVSAAGNYTVEVTDGNGCSAVSTATTVTVNPLPSVPVITANGSTEFCQGGSVELTSSAASSYLWSTGETTPSITVSAAGNYTVEVTDGNGCSAVSTATSVTVNPLPSVPVITANGSTEFCQGGSVELTSSAASSYLWSTGETTPSIMVSAAGNYTVEVTDGNGCSATSNVTTVTVNNSLPVPVISANGSAEFCDGDSVVLTSSMASSYLWSTGETTSSITVSAAGNYTVEVTDGNGCSATSEEASVIVNQLPSVPVISANGPTEFCEGGSVALTSSTASSYLWSTGELAQSIVVSVSGNYSVEISNENGCSATSDSIEVVVNSTPSIQFELVDTVCVNANDIPLNATPAGGNYFGVGISSGAFSPQTAGQGTFQLTYDYTDANGCFASASETIIVDGCAGIEDDKLNSLKVFPNPTSDILNINLTGTFDVKILDSRGRLVYQEGANNNLIVDMARFEMGIYYVEIMVGESNKVIKVVNK